MTTQLIIKCYPLMGAFRAECQACGAYGTSNFSKNQSDIGQALENLANDPTLWSIEERKQKQLACKHNYAIYKPSVVCQIDYKHLSDIKSCFYTSSDTNCPNILLDNTYKLDIINIPDACKWENSIYQRMNQHEISSKRVDKKIISDAVSNPMPAIMFDLLIEKINEDLQLQSKHGLLSKQKAKPDDGFLTAMKLILVHPLFWILAACLSYLWLK